MDAGNFLNGRFVAAVPNVRSRSSSHLGEPQALLKN
jgi:hypothetical protein